MRLTEAPCVSWLYSSTSMLTPPARAADTQRRFCSALRVILGLDCRKVSRYPGPPI